MNVALIGSNFALRGYLPVIKKINKLNLKIICSRNIKKNQKISTQGVILENNWKNVFKYNIDLIILAVPPRIQEKILLYNLKFKKKIIFEKPISTNYLLSKKIVEKLKKNKIKSEINLTFLSHPLFLKVNKIIDKKILGSVIDYKIHWSFVSPDFNRKIKSWKTDENNGGGIKNIFLTHVFSYCEFFFKKLVLESYKIKISKFKRLRFKKHISIKLTNQNKIRGDISIMTKKNGFQSHKVKINFENGKVLLFTNSKDWTKNFILKIYINKPKKIKTYKNTQKILFKDGRSQQIFIMIKNFIKSSSYRNLEYCLNAEKINNKLF